MKNENDMETILKTNGFIQTGTENEYSRGTWIIRLEGNKIEVFNGEDDKDPRYLFEDINKINLSYLFEELNYTPIS